MLDLSTFDGRYELSFLDKTLNSLIGNERFELLIFDEFDDFSYYFESSNKLRSFKMDYVLDDNSTLFIGNERVD
jgi:hypothetical protein